MKKQIIAATALMLAISSTAYASDNINIFVNGNALNTGAFIMNDSTYIPLRAVSEALGSNVNWDGNTRSVYIDSDEDTVTAQVIDNITVVFSDGESYAGQVQAIDKDSDLAMVKVGRLGLKPISFAQSDSIFAGQSVVAIGTPLSLSMRNSASKGIVSGLNVSTPSAYYPLIQTDAAINAGNSGGPLLNMKGQLIGINSSKYAGVGIEGINFSIPLDTINYVLNQFEQNGKVIRPDLGVTLENSWEARIGLPTKKGVTVKTSSSSSLSNGDVINSINGVEVHSIVDFNKALRDTYSSGSINVIYTRNGEQISTDIVPNLK